MKKKTILILLIYMFTAGLLMLSGCGSEGNKTTETNITTNTETKYDEFKLYDKTIKLDQKEEFKKMTLMSSKDSFSKRSSSQTGISFNYEDESKTNDIITDYGATVVSIAIRYFENKDIDTVMSKAPYKRTNKTVGNIEYQYFDYVDNGINGYCYCYYHEGSTYTITFEAKININDLIDAFMKNVKFN